MNRQIEIVGMDEITPYENNPRINDNAIDKVVESISEFGFTNPILLDENNVIIAGHTRYEASKVLGLDEVPCIYLTDLSEEQIKAYRLVDNKASEFAGWDFEALSRELAEIGDNIDMSLFDFEEMLENVEIGGVQPLTTMEKIKNNPMNSNLFDAFLFPPFSYIDTKTKRWIDRRNIWKELGIKSEVGRDEDLTFSKSLQSESLGGTSIFDPVLCELGYTWFVPGKGSNIIDPFAGGSVRGIVAGSLGFNYTGIDLRQEQIDANYNNANEIGLSNINWLCDNSQNILNHVKENSMDLMFTCPPYFDLEVYSDNENDISNMSFEEFDEVYRDILRKTARTLKNNRFAVVVISDVRDKQGFYRDLTGITKRALAEEGCYFYNDLILLNSAGSAAIRARKSMGNRKVVRIHQNVLVFYKGNPKEIKLNFPELETYEDPEIFSETFPE